jgi:hypothetical protein
MLTIPLYVFLFLYFAFLLVFVIFSILNFYHIVMSDSFTLASFVFSFFIFTLTVLTLYFTYFLLKEMDWRQPLLTIDLSLFSFSQNF